MSLPGDVRMRRAGPADREAVTALRESAGWSTHEWAMRFSLEDPASHFVVVEDAAGAPIGTGSGVCYGPFGVVGNMVVAALHRRRGIGTAILEAVMSDLRARGAARIELYATSDGRPLYERAGFGPIEPGSRVDVPRGTPLDVEPSLEVSEPMGADAIAAFDAPRFGGDRLSLLARMVADPERPMFVARRRDSVAGFAWLRADGERLGPFMADDPGVAAALLAAAIGRLPQASAISFNLPMANDEGVEWVRSLGVEPDPWDGRMALGADVPRRVTSIYGNAVGALG